VYSKRKPAYTIVDLGDTQIDGRAVFHLGLTPIYEPERRNLLHILAHRQCGDDRAILGERQGVGHRSLRESKIVGRANCVPLSDPDWVFDQAQWTAHRGEQIPSLAPPRE
jgi:hypothetical protein